MSVLSRKDASQKCFCPLTFRVGICGKVVSSPGIEPGSSQPQCEILTTVRTRPIASVNRGDQSRSSTLACACRDVTAYERECYTSHPCRDWSCRHTSEESVNNAVLYARTRKRDSGVSSGLRVCSRKGSGVETFVIAAKKDVQSGNRTRVVATTMRNTHHCTN